VLKKYISDIFKDVSNCFVKYSQNDLYRDVFASQQLKNVRIAYQSYLIMNNNKKYGNGRRKLKLRYIMERSERESYAWKM